MAVPPVGQSCANCVFYIGIECRRFAPIIIAGSSDASRWPSFLPTQWCAYWNIWPGMEGGSGGGIAGAISSGEVAPSGGVDGDYYVLYEISGDAAIHITIYQKQAGAWVVIETIL